MFKKLKITSIILTIIATGLLYISGVVLYSPMGEEMGITPCQMNESVDSMCPMDAFTHLEMLSQTVMMIPAEKVTLPLLAIFFIALSFAFAAYRKPDIFKSIKNFDPPEQNLFQYLIGLFSQGLLHPRLYA